MYISFFYKTYSLVLTYEYMDEYTFKYIIYLKTVFTLTYLPIPKTFRYFLFRFSRLVSGCLE